jgi:hypothetical protein
MEQKEQTAVEWLVEQLENHNGVTRQAFENIIKQAKEMEQQQMKKHLLMGAAIMADEYGQNNKPI